MLNTHLSALHSDHCRHGRNFKLLSNLLMLIDVDCNQIHNFSSHDLWLGSNPLQSGREKITWLTPGCEEIYQDWSLSISARGGENSGLKLGGVDIFVYLEGAGGGSEGAEGAG